LELPVFLHKLVIKFDLIFILVTTIDEHSELKLITHKLLYFFVYIEYIITKFTV
jgi:hypothetical protein